MRKLFHHYLIALAVLLLYGTAANAQQWTIAVCSGGPPAGTLSNTYGPMYSVATANATNRTAVIYPASQLSALAGSILTNAYFHRNTTAAMAGTPNFKIYLKEVSATDWGSGSLTWATEIAGATLVYNSDPASTLGTTVGWKNFPFSTNFPYSGSQNLAVFFEYTNATASGAITWSYEYTSACINTSNSNTTKYSNNTTGTLPTTLATSEYRRPYIGFDFFYPPCVSPPTAGAAVASNVTPCFGQTININLSGNSFGSSQTYQWESATSLAGPWNAMGAAQTAPGTTASPSVGTTYYRCQVTCGTSTVTSTVATVVVPTPFPGGTYTINSAVATGGSNFQNFTAAMSALGCGISGPVVLNVVPGSGPYTEQIVMPNTLGSNATNKLTINGNGATVEFNAAATYTGVLMMNGVSHVKIDSLTFKCLNATYGFGAILYNSCDNDSITRCTFDLTNVTSTSTANSTGIRISSTASGTSTTISGATNTYIGDCRILCSTGNQGSYYGLYSYGPNNNNVYHRNFISNFYYAGVYDAYGNNVTVSNNHITAITKSSVANYVNGIYSTNATNGTKYINNLIKNLGGATGTNTYYSYPIYAISGAGSSTVPILIANNIITNSTLTPIYGLYVTGNNWDVFHNTINIDVPVTMTSTQNGIYSTSTNSRFQNNIVSITAGGTSTKYGLYYSSATVAAVSDYNNVYVNSTQSGTQNYGYRGSAYSTFSSFKSATSLETNGHDVDPMFLSVATTNLTPTNAVLDDMGTPVPSVTSDYYGATRSLTTPDIGAIEFSVPPCAGMPNNGTVTGPATVCTGATFNVNATGLTIATGIIYDWQYNDGSGWISTGGLNTSYTVTGGIATPTQFRLVTTCTNTNQVATSNVISVALNPWYNCYCTPVSTCTNEGIQNVTFNTINNNSNKCTNTNGYEDFSSLGSMTTVSQGQTIPMSVTAWINSNPAGAGVWIDYDHNGVFDAAEFTLLGTTTSFTGTAGAYNFSAPVTIDMGAMTGITRMRVRSSNSTAATLISATTPCLNTNAYGEYEDYLITINPAPPCTGAPTAGTASKNVDSLCPGGSVQLTLLGYTVGTGITIQWQESLGSGIWNPIAGATTPVYTHTFSAAASYRAAVTCNAGAPVYSNVLSVTQQPVYACYCSPMTGVALHTNTGNYITKVEVATTGLSATTTAVGTGGYTRNYPTTSTNSTTLTQVVNYNLNVTLGAATYRAIAWIDYDHSGTFDMGEEVLFTNSGTTAVGLINIPSTALTGLTGMRVRAASNATTFTSADACLSSATGYETEDFIVNVIANVPCNGVPSSAGTATVNKDTFCVTGDVKLNLTNYPQNLGVVLNWQSSPAGANTFTDIPGANTDTFTVYGVTTSMDYRARVTCTNSGGGTAYSNVKPVVVSNPQLTSIVPGSRCGTGSVALYAQASNGGVVNWYAAPTGGSVLATGNVFVTPSISATTSYYAAPGSGGATTQTTAMPPTLPNVSTTTNAGLLIDINTDLVLNSVNVFSINGGTVAVELRNSAGIIVAGPVSFPLVASTYTNPQTLTLNFPMPAGTGYRLLATPSAALAYQGGSYPLPLGNGVGNVVNGAVGTTTTSTLNYYFYNLKTSVGCEGTRTQVDATINPAGTGNLATGGTVVGNTQADGTTVNYDAPCADKLATVVDAAGGNVLGATSATVIVSPTVQTYNTKPYVARVHDITPASSGPATVTIYALQSEFNAYNSYVTTNSLSLPLMPTSAADPNASNIVVTQWHGSANAGKTGPGGLYGAAGATLIPNSAITKTSNGTYWTLTFPVTGFSGFFIHTGAAPLTIQLASIAATNHGNRNRIDWMTTDEKEAAYFELESSTDAKSFERLGREEAKGKATNYSYWDEQPAKGMNYYRLKMYDKAGAFTYSDVVKAFVNGTDAFMVEAFPNPATDVVNVRVNGVQGKDAKILVTDLAGKVIQTLTMNGANQMINVSGLANGVYMIKYVDSNHQQTMRVTKQ